MRKQIWMWGCAAALAPRSLAARRRRPTWKSSRQAAAVLKSSFKANGQAGLDRLDQDDTQRLCTQYANKPLPKDVAEMIEKMNLASIKWPADGKWTGRLEKRRAHRAGRPRQAILRRSQGPGGRQLLCVPSALAAGSLVRDHRSFALRLRQAARLQRRDRASTRTARSGTPMPIRRAPTCRASATARFFRATGEGPGRAADGPRLPRQQVTTGTCGVACGGIR